MNLKSGNKRLTIFCVLLLLSGMASIHLYGQKDGTKNNNDKKDKIKPFEKVIPSSAEVYRGPFPVYRCEGKVYFEIPDSLQERDFLLASRIAKVSNPSKAVAGEMRRSPALVKFRRDNKKVYLMKEVLNFELDDDTSNLKAAFDRNSILPVFETFEIKAFGKDKQSAIIDVTDFFSKEIEHITPFASKGKPGKLQKEATFISKIQAFSTNIEIQTYFNYDTKSDPFRALVNRSFLLLPKEPMKPRLADRRINYFSSSRKIFADDGDISENRQYINRFRLEPREVDRARYFKGEMVEPAKPIIVYVDNGLPERWQKYVMQGIEDWQKAFEAIGFKNAIQARPFPDDPDFNPDDLRHTCFRYITDNTVNAMGPRWTDPRSGEIIRGDVIWYHDVIQKLHDWRLVQCGAVEKEARKKVFSDELMGRIIRYAASHEIGHVLGFQHNMRASYAYPVDSLRSPTFTQTHGTTPSIMDYARFNYIAQPGDDNVNLTPPPVGEYDVFAIKWGYKPIKGAETPEAEYDTLNQWFLNVADDPVYQFTPQFAMGISGDPAAQAEALGDDAIKAGKYGVKNARFIMGHLTRWCTTEGKDYDYLRRIYEEVIKQYNRYLEHATSYLGGAYRYFGVEGQEQPLFTPVKKQKQREALNWIMNEITHNHWILNQDIQDRLGPQKADWYELNVDVLDNLMSGFIFQRLQTHAPNYRVSDYLSDLSGIVWSFPQNSELSKIEMVLQQSFVRNLALLARSAASAPARDTKAANPSDWFNKEEALTLAKSSKINYIDHFVAMAALDELLKAQDIVKKKMKKGGHLSHYQLLLRIINSSLE